MVQGFVTSAEHLGLAIISTAISSVTMGAGETQAASVQRSALMATVAVLMVAEVGQLTAPGFATANATRTLNASVRSRVGS